MIDAAVTGLHIRQLINNDHTLEASEGVLHLFQSRSNDTIAVLHNTRTERIRLNDINSSAMRAN